MHVTTHVTAIAQNPIGNKGFAFIKVDAGADVFIHEKVIKAAEINPALLQSGTALVVDIETFPDGRRRAYWVRSIGAVQAISQPRPQSQSHDGITPPLQTTLIRGDSAEGALKWFNHEKGYGFVIVPGHPDLFFHISNVREALLPTLTEGTTFRFTVDIGRKGPVAILEAVVDEQQQPVA